MSIVKHILLSKCHDIEVGTVLVGFGLIGIYGAGIITNKNLLYLGMAIIATGVGLEQFDARRGGFE